MAKKRFAAFQTAPADPRMEQDFLTLAGTLSQKTQYPGMDQVEKVAQRQKCPTCPTIGFQDFPGRGFGGAVQLPGEPFPWAVLMGTRAFLEESGLQVPGILEATERVWREEGADVLMGGWEGYVRGLFKFISD